MKRWHFMLISFLVCFFLVGFTEIDPNLQQYRRLPLSIRLKRLLLAGKDLFNRRRYEDAMAVFDCMRKLDPKNLDAYLWQKKCEERLFREKNESVKNAIIAKQGNLKMKESGFENLTWGPTSGHFEVRYSQPKPHIIPPKKVRPRASDAEIARAMEAASKEDPKALFHLAMLHKTRGENLLAVAAWEKAVTKDPELLSEDDEGLTTSILDATQKSLEKGNISPGQRVLSAKVSLLQGDWNTAIIQFIKAASKDKAFIKPAEQGLKKIIDSGQTGFLQQVPEISGIAHAYAYEEDKDRFYLWAKFYPKTPFYIFPFDIEVESSAIKSIKIESPDILFTILDPFVRDTTRIWAIGKDEDDQVKALTLKLVIELDPSLQGLNLSNYSVETTLPGNWSLVFGAQDSFGAGFPAPTVEKIENGVIQKAYQLSFTSGKGPTLYLPDFRKPLPGKVDIWKAIEDVFRGTL